MRTALVVLGHSEPGSCELSSSCIARVHRAGELAQKLQPEFVILSGWGRAGAPKTEAELMEEAWPIPGTLLIRDPWACSTAENALFARQIIDGYGEIERLIAVTSGWHSFRTRVFFRAAFRDTPVRTQVVSAREDGYLPRETLVDLCRLKHARRGLHEGRARLAAAGLHWDSSQPRW